MQEIQLSTKQKASFYKIIIGSELIQNCGGWLRETLTAEANKVAIISNRRVFNLYGKTVTDSIEKAGLQTSVYLIPDGERHKNLRTLGKVLDFLCENRLRRTDAVVAVGGGVIGDLAGFAAAIYLRGVCYLQIPTTLLAMIDSSVGGKTGIDTRFGKNLVGAFHQPKGVLVDVSVLRSLPSRELTSGLCEAIKQGALSGEELFHLTARFLEDFPVKRFRDFFSEEVFLRRLESFIASHVAFKAEVVYQDEKEDVARVDRMSRKILNFGHTVAHALERVTDYKFFKHGEAVGIGILIEAEISRSVVNFPETELKLLSEAVKLAGKLPTCEYLNQAEILQAITFDKKNIGSELEWILLEKIGKPAISRKVSQEIVSRSIQKFVRGEIL